MTKPLTNFWPAKLRLFGFASLALIVCRAQAEYDPGWTKNFRVGALAGLGIKGQIRLRGQFNANGSNPQAGIYDDGYVHPDAGTATDGLTSFWGYQSGSQYDAGTQTLQMNSASSFTTEGGSSKLDQQFTVGVEVAYGNKLRHWGRTSLGWEFGFGYLPLSMKSDSSAAIDGSVIQSAYNFDASGIIMPGFPYNAGPGGFGPLIGAAPTGATTNTVAGTIRETGTLDASLFTFRLGPTLFYDVSPHFGIAAGIGPAFGILSETVKYNELVSTGVSTPSRTRGKFGTTDLVYGAYLNLVATYHADENGDIYLGVQYMPMSGSTFSEGGREASVNLTGQFYFMLGVNWIF